MIARRPAGDRGHVNHGWLDTWHTFSFSRYVDRDHMGFRNLRVINEDFVQPGQGFGTHPHRDMEIITVVLEGALQHRDSMGTGSIIRPGEVQVMSAGTGVTHSEFNASDTEPVHLLQIWVLPDAEGHTPRYDQREFPEKERRNQLRLVVSPDGVEASLSIHQDVRIHSALLEPGAEVEHVLVPGRHAWIQVARGPITANGVELGPGDGAAVSEEAKLTLTGIESAEILIFDLN